MASYYCKTCGALDEQGIDGHATNRCKGASTMTRPYIELLRNHVCNQCVTKDKEIERLRNQLAEKREHLVNAIETVAGDFVKPKRDRADYMRRYRATKETKAS